jgi:hypothetical protein
VTAVDRCAASAGGGEGIRDTDPVSALWICCG